MNRRCIFSKFALYKLSSIDKKQKLINIIEKYLKQYLKLFLIFFKFASKEILFSFIPLHKSINLLNYVN